MIFKNISKCLSSILKVVSTYIKYQKNKYNPYGGFTLTACSRLVNATKSMVTFKRKVQISVYFLSFLFSLKSFMQVKKGKKILKEFAFGFGFWGFWGFLAGFLTKPSMGSHAPVQVCTCVSPPLLLFPLASCDKTYKRHMNYRDTAAADESRNSSRTQEKHLKGEVRQQDTQREVYGLLRQTPGHIFTSGVLELIYCPEEPLYLMYFSVSCFVTLLTH